MKRRRIQEIIEKTGPDGTDDGIMEYYIKKEVASWKSTKQWREKMERIKKAETDTFTAEFATRREIAIRYYLEKAKTFDFGKLDISTEDGEKRALLNLIRDEDDKNAPVIWMTVPFDLSYSYKCYSWDYPWHHCPGQVKHVCVLTDEFTFGACERCFVRSNTPGFFFWDHRPSCLYPKFLRVLQARRQNKKQKK